MWSLRRRLPPGHREQNVLARSDLPVANLVEDVAGIELREDDRRERRELGLPDLADVEADDFLARADLVAALGQPREAPPRESDRIESNVDQDRNPGVCLHCEGVPRTVE